MEESPGKKAHVVRPCRFLGSLCPLLGCLANPSGGGSIVWEVLSVWWSPAGISWAPLPPRCGAGGGSIVCETCRRSRTAGLSPCSVPLLQLRWCPVGYCPPTECLKEMKHSGSGSGLPPSSQPGAEEPLRCVGRGCHRRQHVPGWALERQTFIFSRFRRLQVPE